MQQGGIEAIGEDFHIDLDQYMVKGQDFRPF